MRIKASLSLIFILTFTLLAQEKFTLDDQFNLTYPTSISISPDGKFTAFIIRKANFEKAKWETQLYLLNNIEKKYKQLTYHPAGVNKFKFSTDSKFIYFTTRREFWDISSGEIVKDKLQLWRIRIDGGEAENFLRIPNGIEEFVFSPNGKFLAILSEADEGDSIKKISEQKYKTKNDETVYPKKNSDKEIWLFDFSTNELKKIFRGDPGISNITFSAQSDFLLYQTNYTGEYNDDQKHDIYKLTLDGKAIQLTDLEGPETKPNTSPDGKYISFITQTIPDIEFAEQDLVLLDSKTNQKINITKNFNLSIIDYIWHPKDQKIYLLVNESVYQTCYLFDLRKNTFTKLNIGESVISNLEVSHNNELFLLYEDSKSLKEIGRYKNDSFILLTDFSNQLVKFQISKPELIKFRSKDDKFDIEAILLKPVNFDPSKKYPLILCIHGGPYSSIKRTFLQSYPMQVYANEGYFVVAPNFRGSSGYSDEFGQANRYDLGGGDYEDLMASVDYLIKNFPIDTNKLGVIGGSYGGYMTNWIISQTNRFRAAVSMYGIFSFFTDFSNSWQPIFEKMYFGYYYWEKPIDSKHLWVNRSPAFYVTNIKTPVLILQGDSDLYTNIANSQEMYQALITLGREFEYVVYPREGHGIRNEPQHYYNMLTRGLNWFKKYFNEN